MLETATRSNKIAKQMKASIAKTSAEMVIGSKVAQNQAKSIATLNAKFALGYHQATRFFSGLTRTLVGVTKGYLEFNRALVKVAKTTDLTEREFETFEGRIKTLSSNLGVSAVELGEIASIAGQLGIRGVAQLEKFTDVVAKLVSATNLNAEEASFSLARILNLTGADLNKDLDSVEILGAQIVALGNNLPTTEKEIAEMGREVSKAAGLFGATTTEVISLSAAISAVGGRAESSRTAINKFYAGMEAIRLGRNDLGLINLAKILGTDEEDALRQLENDFVGVTNTIIKRLSTSTDTAQDFFDVIGLKDQRTTITLKALMQTVEQYTKAREIATKEEMFAYEHIRETEKRLESLSGRFDKATESIKNSTKGLGEFIAELATASVEVTALTLEDITFDASNSKFRNAEQARQYEKELSVINKLAKRRSDLQVERDQQVLEKLIFGQDRMGKGTIKILTPEEKKAIEDREKALSDLHNKYVMESDSFNVPDPDKIAEAIAEELARQTAIRNNQASYEHEAFGVYKPSIDQYRERQEMLSLQRASILQGGADYQFNVFENQNEVSKRLEEIENERIDKIKDEWSSATDSIGQGIADLATGVESSFTNVFMNVLNEIQNTLAKRFISDPLSNAAGDLIGNVIAGGFGGNFDTAGYIDGLATGGVVKKGGLAVVGERGAEVVDLPTGSAVYPNGSIPSDMVGGITVNVNGVQDPDTVKRVVFQTIPHFKQSLVNEVAQQIGGNTRINRAIQG